MTQGTSDLEISDCVHIFALSYIPRQFMSIENLKSHLRTVPDFPKMGILFYDITTLFKNPDCLQELSDTLYEMYKDKGITKVVGIESRGYIMGAILAERLGAGFVMVRKAGKLPAEVYSESYDLEYGQSIIEIHQDAIDSQDVVLIHDDLLATGGTTEAARLLVERFHPKEVLLNFIIELKDLDGRKAFPAELDVTSVLQL